jgi:transcriptional regulator with XRE-family HTH domain
MKIPFLADFLNAKKAKPLTPDEIRTLRDKLGLSEHELSEFLQIDTQTYHRWESGRARPSRLPMGVLCYLQDWLAGMITEPKGKPAPTDSASIGFTTPAGEPEIKPAVSDLAPAA